ncbi:hypothetical protein CK203_018431 [Vitis vinifera]|uniref:Uncharacterized protein n=1 Tax=Vitis vinifera TaxID=29760 RepID=A0A438J5Z0_VITVI|nr:hypothetical protein CK203_018431 [Vitis vinifera]
MSWCQMLGRGVGSRVVGILTSQGILMIEIGRGGGLVLKIASFGSEKRSGGCFELERKSWTPMRGSVLEQNFNHRPTQKEGMEYAE